MSSGDLTMSKGEHWIQLHSGAPFWLDGPPSAVDIRDVAAGLAKINRFAGATIAPYSVAQHSVHVSKLVDRLGGSKRDQLIGLLHDAHEIVLGDLPSPVKWALNEEAGKKIVSAFENRIQERILKGLGIKAPGARYDLVNQADLIALATEKRDLLRPARRSWKLDLPEPDKGLIRPVSWAAAERAFLSRYVELRL